MIHHIRDIDRIAEALGEIPEVTLVSETTGRFDLIIYVAARSLEHLTRFVRRQIATIDGIHSTETFVAPKVYKSLRDWRLPIDELGPGG